MSFRFKIKGTKRKIFILPVICIILFLALAENLLITYIDGYLCNLKDDEALRLSKNIMSRFSNASLASDIITELVDQRLRVASKTVVRCEDIVSNAFLKQVAIDMEVDEIYWYNPQGKILYSNTGKYVGWRAYEGHPVRSFMESSSSSYIEDVRKDTESNLYYKFGYMKCADGFFVQVGILADKIRNLNKVLNIQYFIDSQYDEKEIKNINFIDNNYIITASSDKKLIGYNSNLGSSEKAYINENKHYASYKAIDKIEYYEVLLPLYVNGTKQGTLQVLYKVESIKRMTIEVSLLILVMFMLLLTIFGFMLSLIIKRSSKLKRIAFYDSLTGLPNKMFLVEYLEEKLKSDEIKKSALLIINFSNFKKVNLIFGHKKSEEMLLDLSDILKPIAINEKQLFKLGEDKFIIYVDSYLDRRQLVELCNSINGVINKNSKGQSDGSFIKVTMGIIEIDYKNKDVNKLINNVTIAVNSVKNSMDINYAFFNENMERKLLRDAAIENELRKAIEDNDNRRIYLVYQPQVDLKTGEIIGFEALCRMRSETMGYILPTEFIDIAEKRHLIIQLGNMILRSACIFIKNLEIQGFRNIKVAVNISPIQLLQEEFHSNVMKIIEETDIIYSNLELEITETAFLDNYQLVNAKLESFRELGVKIALDDFGIGYSSLSRLDELQIDSIKIDKYFMDKLFTENNSNIITANIISLAHQLGVTVIAEGVETDRQKEYLLANDCDSMQGYLFSKPISEEEVITPGVRALSQRVSQKE